jgi:predicted RNase H-like nuclease
VVHGADWALTPARDTFASSYPEHARGSQPEPSWNEFADRAQRNQRVRDALSGTVNADDQARIDAVLDSPVCGYFGEYWVVDAAMEQFSAQVGDSTEAWVFVSEFAGSLDCTLRELASLAVKVSSN